MYVCTYVCMYVMYVCMYVMYVCMYACMYVWYGMVLYVQANLFAGIETKIKVISKHARRQADRQGTGGWMAGRW